MAIDIEKYRAYLGKIEVPARFRILRPVEEVEIMLEETYKHKVAARKMQYDPKYITPLIQKASTWIATDRKPGLLLYGTVGSGKTTMADSLVTLIGAHPYSQKIYRKTAIEINDAARDDPDRYEAIKKAELLFIDDLGLESDTVKKYGNVISPITEVILHRYDRQMFTVITTNLTMEDDQLSIKQCYGVRIEDRILEMFDRIYFKHPSYRRK